MSDNLAEQITEQNESPTTKADIDTTFTRRLLLFRDAPVKRQQVLPPPFTGNGPSVQTT